jgi:hypothetical protein
MPSRIAIIRHVCEFGHESLIIKDRKRNSSASGRTLADGTIKAPLGGQKCHPNPLDRGTSASKHHLLADAQGAPHGPPARCEAARATAFEQGIASKHC